MHTHTETHIGQSIFLRSHLLLQSFDLVLSSNRLLGQLLDQLLGSIALLLRSIGKERGGDTSSWNEVHVYIYVYYYD